MPTHSTLGPADPIASGVPQGNRHCSFVRLRLDVLKPPKGGIGAHNWTCQLLIPEVFTRVVTPLALGLHGNMSSGRCWTLGRQTFVSVNVDTSAPSRSGHVEGSSAFSSLCRSPESLLSRVTSLKSMAEELRQKTWSSLSAGFGMPSPYRLTPNSQQWQPGVRRSNRNFSPMSFSPGTVR